MAVAVRRVPGASAKYIILNKVCVSVGCTYHSLQLAFCIKLRDYPS